MFRGCTMAQSPATSFHGQLLQALLNPRVKLLDNIPGLPISHSPATSFSWAALTRSTTGFYGLFSACFWLALIVPADRANPLSRSCSSPAVRLGADGPRAGVSSSALELPRLEHLPDAALGYLSAASPYNPGGLCQAIEHLAN